MPPEPEGFETWWKLHGRFLHGRDATVKDIARDGWQAALAQAAQVVKDRMRELAGEPVGMDALDGCNEALKAIRRLGETR